MSVPIRIASTPLIPYGNTSCPHRSRRAAASRSSNCSSSSASSRVTGQRHGRPRNDGPTADTTYASGTCNVLFLDGHAQPVDRAALPGKPDNGIFSMQIIGTRDQMLNPANPGVTNEFIWNLKQQ